VVGFRRVRLQRWIPLYEDPVTLEVRARVLPPSVPLGVADAISEVVLEIHDLGNDRQPGGAETPAVEGTVTLADRYPSPPQIDDFPLTNQRPCRMGPDEFYRTERRLFHGPVFQAVCANDRIGDGGIEGRLETLSHAGLFASTPRPGLLLDPILIDASTHILGSWHLSQEDRAGRVVFPYELGSVQFFGPRPAEGSRLKCRVQIEQLSRRQVSHRIDLITPDGKLWCRLQPAEYWRFYWPAECVDFFRHHDRYLVSRDLPAALPAKPVAGNGRAAPAVPASVRWLLADRSPDVVQPVIRAALARVALSRREWRQFYEMKGPQQRLTEWLFGRMAAKDCVRALWQRLHGRRLFPADMEIDTDEHGRPLVRLLGEAAAELPRISIAHSGGVVAAMAAFARRVGIDLEPVLPRDAKFERTAFDRRERELLDRFGGDRDEAIARFWCAKEAVAKALGRGLVEGPGTVAVRQVDPQSGTLRLALGTQLKSLFPDLQSALLVAWTSRQEEIVVATTFAETGAAG